MFYNEFIATSESRLEGVKEYAGTGGHVQAAMEWASLLLPCLENATALTHIWDFAEEINCNLWYSPKIYPWT